MQKIISVFLLLTFLGACQSKNKKETVVQKNAKEATKIVATTAKNEIPKRPIYPYKKVIERLPNGIRFSISGVDTSKTIHRDTTFYVALSDAFRRKIEGFSTADAHRRFNSIWADGHGFMHTLHHAYNDHHPLTISPDMIWLLICQGVSNHVNANADKLRPLIVNHADKKLITIEENDFVKYGYNPWQNILPKLTDSIQKYIKSDFYEAMITKFSTTTNTETIAFQTALLEATQQFFEYAGQSGCGLPYITLEGTPNDWRKIKKDLEKLRKYELSYWIDELLPILDEFILASEGIIHEDFWCNIYKFQYNYDKSFFNGWIIKFLPYLKGERVSTNQTSNLGILVYGNLKPNSYLRGNDYQKAKLTFKDLPKGISSFDFKWLYRKEFVANFDMVFASGFVGFEQDKQTKALRPLIHWAVYDKNAPATR